MNLANLSDIDTGAGNSALAELQAARMEADRLVREATKKYRKQTGHIVQTLEAKQLQGLLKLVLEDGHNHITALKTVQEAYNKNELWRTTVAKRKSPKKYTASLRSLDDLWQPYVDSGVLTRKELQNACQLSLSGLLSSLRYQIDRAKYATFSVEVIEQQGKRVTELEDKVDHLEIEMIGVKDRLTVVEKQLSIQSKGGPKKKASSTDVLELKSKGDSIKLIAQKLNISVSTVQRHLRTGT